MNLYTFKKTFKDGMKVKLLRCDNKNCGLRNDCVGSIVEIGDISTRNGPSFWIEGEYAECEVTCDFEDLEVIK